MKPPTLLKPPTLFKIDTVHRTASHHHKQLAHWDANFLKAEVELCQHFLCRSHFFDRNKCLR